MTSARATVREIPREGRKGLTIDVEQTASGAGGTGATVNLKLARGLSVVAAILVGASGTAAFVERGRLYEVFDTRPVPELEVVDYYAADMDQTYRLYIQLPPSYPDGDRRYPVVYAVDGDFVMDLLYEDHVLPLMQRREIPEIILIGIGYGDTSEFGAGRRRLRDYTPSQSFDDIETGHASEFLAFVVDGILPFIDATYRTDPDNRCIAGHSLGGLFSFYAALSRPDVFGKAIASSPSFHWGLRGIFELEESIASERDDWDATLYMSVGLRESSTMHVNYHDMIDVLNNRIYPRLRMHHEMHEGKDHGDAVEPAAVNGLRFVFQAN